MYSALRLCLQALSGFLGRIRTMPLRMRRKCCQRKMVLAAQKLAQKLTSGLWTNKPFLKPLRLVLGKFGYEIHMSLRCIYC